MQSPTQWVTLPSCVTEGVSLSITKVSAAQRCVFRQIINIICPSSKSLYSNFLNVNIFNMNLKGLNFSFWNRNIQDNAGTMKPGRDSIWITVVSVSFALSWTEVQKRSTALTAEHSCHHTYQGRLPNVGSHQQKKLLWVVPIHSFLLISLQWTRDIPESLLPE